MRILYISQYFPPEPGAPAARVSELSKRWSEVGHEVTVLTGFPNHPTGELLPDYRARFRRLTCREDVGNVKVVRTWLIPLPNRRPHERILNYSSFFLSATIRGLFLTRPSLVIGTSPQLLVGLSAWLIAKIKRVPFVFEVRDIWPDAILASGVGREGSRFARVLTSISRFLHSKCDLLVAVTPAFVEELAAGKWNVPVGKMAVVLNGVEEERFSPLGSRTARATMGVEDRFVISYIGTVGQAHGLSTILEAARVLRDRMPRAVFVVAGDGAERESLQRRAHAEGLDNVRFLGHVPKEQVPDLIRSSDLCLVLLKDAAIFRTVIPTKMLEFMACARPVLIGVDGQARSIIESAGAGIFFPPQDASRLVTEIERLHDDPDLRAQMGSSGRSYVLNNFTRKQTSEDYLTLLERLV